MRREVLVTSALFFGFACGQIAHAQTKVPWSAYMHPQRMVSIDGGRRMNVYCLGSGSPPVILDAGGGNSMRSWRDVQPAMATMTRVCAYDRAGLGFSDYTSVPRTTANIVADLHALLTAAKIARPYIVVGHSIGSLDVRLFADTYFNEIAGMVLVDPSMEYQERRFAAAVPQYAAYQAKEAAVERKAVKSPQQISAKARYDRCMRTRWADEPREIQAMDCKTMNGNALRTSNSEVKEMNGASASEVAAARHSYGDLPLVVLSAGTFPKGYAGMNGAQTRRFYNLWISMHDELAKLSSRGFNCVVPGAGHGIQNDKPLAVIDAVRYVLKRQGGIGQPHARYYPGCMHA